jgi:hypothetical protein
MAERVADCHPDEGGHTMTTTWAGGRHVDEEGAVRDAETVLWRGAEIRLLEGWAGRAAGRCRQAGMVWPVR